MIASRRGWQRYQGYVVERVTRGQRSLVYQGLLRITVFKVR